MADVGGPQLRRERDSDLLGRRQTAVCRASAERSQMRFDAFELIGDRARIVRIERDQIDHRRTRRHHDVAQPVGDLAVGKFQQNVERAVGRRAKRKLRTKRQVASARSMRRPSSRKRQPASWLMFSCARPENDADDAQRAVDALEHGAFARSLFERRFDQFDQIGERPPGVGREAIADHRRCRLRRADKKRQRTADVALLQHRRRHQRGPYLDKVFRHRLPIAPAAATMSASTSPASDRSRG